MIQQKEVVLVALLGTSPGVLTETVWALATQKKPVLPNKIVLLTTTTGKAKAQQVLLDNGVWGNLLEALKERLPKKEQTAIDQGKKLKVGEASFEVFKNNGEFLDDLRSSEDNLAAADFILDQLCNVTRRAETELLVSIAGGRKTMGALLFSCMSLVGRKQDRMYHVLVNEPYENPRLNPPFYFPTEVTHQVPGQTEGVRGKDAEIELFEVPYVRMRQFYEKELENTSYERLVGVYNQGLKTVIRADKKRGVFFINNKELKVSSIAFALLYVYWGNKAALTARELHNKLHEALKPIRKCGRWEPWYGELEDTQKFKEKLGENEKLPDDVTKVKSDARKKMEKIMPAFLVAQVLPKENQKPDLSAVTFEGFDATLT